MPTLRAPRFDVPVDLDAHIGLLPSSATNRGMFFQDVFRQVRAVAPDVDLATLAGIPTRRYLPFLPYPYADFLRLIHAAARVVEPRRPVGEGLRRVGQTVYDTLVASNAGRVLFSVLGIDFEQICRAAPSGYRLSVNFSKVTSRQVGPRHFLFEYAGLPAFLETFQVGVIEGAARYCHVTCRIQVEVRDLAHATIDVDWT